MSQNAFFAWMGPNIELLPAFFIIKGPGPVLVMYHLYLGEEFMVNYRLEIHYGCSAHTGIPTTSSFQIVFSFQVGMTINQKLNVFRIKAGWIGCNCYFRTNTLLDAWSSWRLLAITVINMNFSWTFDISKMVLHFFKAFMYESRSWLLFAHWNIYQNSEYQFTMMKDCYNRSTDCSSTAFHKIKHEYQLLAENLIGITLIFIKFT